MEEQATPPTPDRDPRIQTWMNAYMRSEEYRAAVREYALRRMVTFDEYRRAVADTVPALGDPPPLGDAPPPPAIAATPGQARPLATPDAVTEGDPAGATDVLTADVVRRAARLLHEYDREFYTADLLGRVMPRLHLYEPTEEQRAEWRRQDEERREARRLAEQRAEGLLLEKLSPEQRQTWAKRRYVEVTGSASGRTYRIRRGVSMNIDCPAAGWTYCAAPANAHETPTEDVVLAQMLWLACDEEGFLRAANRSVYFDPAASPFGDPFAAVRPWGATLLVTDDGWQHLPTFRDDAEPTVADRYGVQIRNLGRTGAAREGVEAWVPACCAAAGCTVERSYDPRRMVTEFSHGGRVAFAIDDRISRRDDRTRGLSAREIRRRLEVWHFRADRTAPR